MKNLKRTFVLVLVLVTAILLVGCGQAKTTKQISNKINKETQKIVQVLNNLDNATDVQLEIKDISPISSGNSSNIATGNVSRKTSDVTKNYEISNTKKVSVSNFNLPKKIGYYDSNNKFVKDNYKVRNINNDLFDSNVNNGNIITNQEKIRNFEYQPKYVNSTSENFTTDNLQNYFAKIEDLYNTCSDCICANAECNNCRQQLKIACNNCKTLCDKLNDGSIQLTDSQIEECNTCLGKLNDCLSKLNSTKGDLNALLPTLKSLLKNYYGNFDSLCSCYGKIGMCLDTRIQDMNDCISCINDLNNIICPNGQCDTSLNEQIVNKNITQTTKSTNNSLNKTYTAKNVNNSTKKSSTQKFYGPIKQKILSAMQTIKKSEKPSNVGTMQTKNTENTNHEKTENFQNISTENSQGTKTIVKRPDRVFPHSSVAGKQTSPITNQTNPSLNQGVENNYANYMANRANGYNNANNMNGIYGNGYYPNGYYGYYKNMPNIDTYALMPRNIDTYQNIYTNIDTYGKDYIYGQNPNSNEDVIVDENDKKDEVILKEDKNNESVLNDSQSNTNAQNNQVIENANEKVNTQLKNENTAIVETPSNLKPETLQAKENGNPVNVQEDVNLNEQTTNAPVVNSPLPNPFDPDKMDKEQNKQELVQNKENGQMEEVQKIENENKNVDNNEKASTM